jgi:hypothetical protein
MADDKKEEEIENAFTGLRHTSMDISHSIQIFCPDHSIPITLLDLTINLLLIIALTLTLTCGLRKRRNLRNSKENGRTLAARG